MTILPPSESNNRPTYASTRNELLQAVRENSIRRGLFFLKNLSALRVDSILVEIDRYAVAFDMELWHEAAPQFGIDSSALTTLDQHEPPVPYPYYFCLPKMLIDNPRLVLYYRNVAMISNKVMNNIGLDTTGHEIGIPMLRDKAEQVASHLNQIISSLVLQAGLFSQYRHREMIYANIGASLDGGWRNEVGRLAYASVMTPLILHLHSQGKVKSMTYKLKGRLALDDEEDKQGGSEQTTLLTEMTPIDLQHFMNNLESERIVYRQFELINGNTILLNRQLYWRGENTAGRGFRIGPDLLTVSSDSDVQYPWAAELKGGADPAGSDEHWKTATQAFNRIIEAANQTGQPVPMLSFMATILVDRVAEEAELWLRHGKLKSVHNLTRIANDPTLQQQFLSEIVGFLEAKSIS